MLYRQALNIARLEACCPRLKSYGIASGLVILPPDIIASRGLLLERGASAHSWAAAAARPDAWPQTGLWAVHSTR